MPSEVTWTTWEELLLACAVKRHGLKDWDSVAMELQSRSALSLLLTSQVCKNKYDDLKRRFTENGTEDVDTTIPWLEELRKLRVSELRQEVHRHDLSIESLQLKVKNLEEERERSLKENEKDDGEPDLEKNSQKERSKNDKEDYARAPEESSPESSAGEGSDRNRSFNESSSTANRSSGMEERTKPEPVVTSEFKPDPVPSDSKPGSEDSFNDSSNTVAKHAATKGSQGKKGGEYSGLRHSVVIESKDGVKESSDVLSSANLTRKRHREKEVPGGSRAVLSPATIKREGVKSEPLVGLLDIIRSHKHGSLFERRLEYQNRDEYKRIVRIHMDLETIRTRLKNGSYSSCTAKFYRDLLLLFTNAIVFFPKSSIESVTAYGLRNIVLEEAQKKEKEEKLIQISDSSPDPDPSTSISLQPKPDPEPPESESLLAKNKSSGTKRKRSSISAKASQTNEKPNPVARNSPKLKEEETKERPMTGTRSTRSNKDGQTITSPNSAEKRDNNNLKNERKKIDLAVKKRGAADFLRRIKRNSPLVVEVEGNNGGGGRRENGKRAGGSKEAPKAKRGGDGRRRKEESSPSKRGVGRPPNRGVERGGKKRRREVVGVDVGSEKTGKRSRR